MKKIICCMLALVMLFSASSSMAAGSLYPTETILKRMATNMIQSLAEGKDVRMLVQDAEMNILQDIAVAFQGVDGQGEPCLYAATPDQRWTVSADAASIEHAEGAFGVDLKEALCSWLEEITGVEEIPVYSPADGEALLAVLSELLSSFTEEAVCLTEDYDQTNRTGTVTLAVNIQVLEKQLDAGITAVLSKHQETLDPLLKKYGALLQTIVPQMPLSCDLLLTSWKALTALVPDHDGTIYLTLSYNDISWTLNGQALDWQVDASWAEGRFLAQLTPGASLPADTAPIIVDSNDLLVLRDFALDALNGISPEAFRLVNGYRKFQLSLDTSRLARDLKVSLFRSANKYDLQAIGERYSYVSDLFIAANVEAADLADWLLDDLMPQLQLQLDWRENADGSWFAEVDWNGIRLSVSGNESSISARLNNGFIRPSVVKENLVNTFDISWSRNGFLATARLYSGYDTVNVYVSGNINDDEFVLHAIAAITDEEKYMDLTLVAKDGHAEISGILNSYAISGDVFYNDSKISCTIWKGERTLFNGSLTFAEDQFSLSMDVDDIRFNLACASNLKDYLDVFFDMNGFIVSAKGRMDDRGAIEGECSIPAWSCQFRHGDPSNQYLRLSRETYQSYSEGRYRYYTQIKQTLFLSQKLDSYEYAYSSSEGKRYALSHWADTWQLQIDNDLYTMEDITQLMGGKENATLFTHSKNTVDGWKVITSVKCIMRLNKDMLNISAYNYPSDDGALLWQATIACGPLNQGENMPKIEPVVPTQWKDHRWLKDYVNQQLRMLTANMSPATLTATAPGYDGADVGVTVTLAKDGTIATLTFDLSQQYPELDEVFDMETFRVQFIGKKGPFEKGEGIDVVSGATATSDGIIQALNSLFSGE